MYVRTVKYRRLFLLRLYLLLLWCISSCWCQSRFFRIRVPTKWKLGKNSHFSSNGSRGITPPPPRPGEGSGSDGYRDDNSNSHVAFAAVVAAGSFWYQRVAGTAAGGAQGPGPQVQLTVPWLPMAPGKQVRSRLRRCGSRPQSSSSFAVVGGLARVPRGFKHAAAAAAAASSGEAGAASASGPTGRTAGGEATLRGATTSSAEEKEEVVQVLPTCRLPTSRGNEKIYFPYPGTTMHYCN